MNYARLSFYLILVCPLLTYGQDLTSCDDLINYDRDKFSKKPVVGIDQKVVLSSEGKNTLVLDISRDKGNATRISISESNGLGCVLQSNKAYFLLRSGEKLKIKNNGAFNCDAEMVLLFGGEYDFVSGYGKKKEYEKLSSEEVEMIRIEISRGKYYEQNLTNEQSIILKNSLACLNPFDK